MCPAHHPRAAQVHTTGMDIKQFYTAKAFLTLGKDMVWRDLAQVWHPHPRSTPEGRPPAQMPPVIGRRAMLTLEE